MKKKWNYYTAKGAAAATAAMLVVTGTPDALLTACAESVQNATTRTTARGANEDENPQSPSNALLSDSDYTPETMETTEGESNPYDDKVSHSFDEDSGTLTIIDEDEIFDFDDELEDFDDELADFNENLQSPSSASPSNSSRVTRTMRTAESTNNSCGKNVFYSFDEDTGTLTITGTGNMANYTENASPWKNWNDKIITVVIQDGVTSIGKYAFNHCASLSKITIGDSVTTIGEAAFWYCTSLSEVTFSDSVTTIDQYAFLACENLNKVTFGDSVTTIGNSAFCVCENLSEVTFGDSVITIGEAAFSLCANLSEVTFGDSVTTIDGWAFEDCTNLRKVTFGDSVTTIGRNAFRNCENLNKITIKAAVPPTLGSYVFDNCKFINSGNTENGIFVLNQYAKNYREQWADYRDNIRALPYGTCGTSTLTISGTGSMDAFTDSSDTPWNGLQDKIETIVMEDGVTSIGDYAFSNFENLTTISFGNQLESIGKSAFLSCKKLTALTLTGVKTIGDEAFKDCELLHEATFGDTVPTIGSDIFKDTGFVQSNTKGIHVPKGKETDYKSAWTEWADYIEQPIDNNKPDSGNDNNKPDSGNDNNKPDSDNDNTKPDSDNDNNKPDSGNDNNKPDSDNDNNKPDSDSGNNKPDSGNDNNKPDSGNDNDKSDSSNDRYDRDDSDNDSSSSSEINAASNSSVPSYAVTGTWELSANGNWSFTDSDGKNYQTTWGYLQNPYTKDGQNTYDWFRFDENGNLVIGWFTDSIDGNIYYMNPVSNGHLGAMLTGWHWIDTDGDGLFECYYFNETSDGTKGRLFRNIQTMDGYTVNEQGQWIVDGKIQTK